jgi:hypothetical protein
MEPKGHRRSSTDASLRYAWYITGYAYSPFQVLLTAYKCEQLRDEAKSGRQPRW